MKMTFAIDCDEVLRSLLSNMISLYNREFNENIEYDDVKDFVVDVSFPKIQETTGITASQWFFQDHSTELFMESEALPKVKEAIEILKEFGDVIIVTYQKTYKNKIETLIHYPIPPHKQKAYKEWNNLSYPITEKIHNTILSLPILQTLEKWEVEKIVEVINKYE